MILNNWRLITNENKHTQVVGNVYGNPNFEDGHLITTSRLIVLDLVNKFIETYNSRYELGTIKEDYLQYCKDLPSTELESLLTFEVGE